MWSILGGVATFAGLLECLVRMLVIVKIITFRKHESGAGKSGFGSG